MPNSPITGPCTDPHFADPGQTSPPNGWGCAPERVDRGRMYLSNCPLQQVNRTRILDTTGRECTNNSSEFRASRAPQKERIAQMACTLWLLHIGRAARSHMRPARNHYGDRTGFPNSTVLNHRELPPPLLSRWGQFDELSVIKVTDGYYQRVRSVGQPPATAGMIDTPAPSGVAVSRPCSNRTSSSFTYTFTNRRSLP